MQLKTKVSVPPVGTVAHRAHFLGLNLSEPLVVGLKGAIRYAEAYRTRWERNVAEDYVLGPEFRKWIDGLRGLLNGDGAVAMERGITTDSKDNGYCESLYWQAMEAGGFQDE